MANAAAQSQAPAPPPHVEPVSSRGNGGTALLLWGLGLLVVGTVAGMLYHGVRSQRAEDLRQDRHRLAARAEAHGEAHRLEVALASLGNQTHVASNARAELAAISSSFAQASMEAEQARQSLQAAQQEAASLAEEVTRSRASEQAAQANATELASELAEITAARQELESRLAAVTAARQELESRLAAVKTVDEELAEITAARQELESRLAAATAASLKGTSPPPEETAPERPASLSASTAQQRPAVQASTPSPGIGSPTGGRRGETGGGSSLPASLQQAVLSSLASTDSILQHHNHTKQQLQGILEHMGHRLAARVQAKDLDIVEENGGVDVRILGRVLFGSGTRRLTPQGRAILREVAAAINPSPQAEPDGASETAQAEEADKAGGDLLKGASLQVVGHTDDVPLSPFLRRRFGSNLGLSMARALEVAHFLKRLQAVPLTQLTAMGRGEAAPVASNETPEGRAQNRRVELRIVPAP